MASSQLHKTSKKGKTIMNEQELKERIATLHSERHRCGDIGFLCAYGSITAQSIDIAIANLEKELDRVQSDNAKRSQD